MNYPYCPAHATHASSDWHAAWLRHPLCNSSDVPRLLNLNFNPGEAPCATETVWLTTLELQSAGDMSVLPSIPAHPSRGPPLLPRHSWCDMPMRPRHPKSKRKGPPRNISAWWPSPVESPRKRSSLVDKQLHA